MSILVQLCCISEDIHDNLRIFDQALQHLCRTSKTKCAPLFSSAVSFRTSKTNCALWLSSAASLQDIQGTPCISAQLWCIFRTFKTICAFWLSFAASVQDIQDNCSKMAQDLRLPVPMHVSSQTHEASPVYASLVEAALSPAKHIPETPTLAVRRWLLGRLYACRQFACCEDVVYVCCERIVQMYAVNTLMQCLL